MNTKFKVGDKVRVRSTGKITKIQSVDSRYYTLEKKAHPCNCYFEKELEKVEENKMEIDPEVLFKQFEEHMLKRIKEPAITEEKLYNLIELWLRTYVSFEGLVLLKNGLRVEGLDYTVLDHACVTLREGIAAHMVKDLIKCWESQNKNVVNKGGI